MFSRLLCLVRFCLTEGWLRFWLPAGGGSAVVLPNATPTTEIQHGHFTFVRTAKAGLHMMTYMYINCTLGYQVKICYFVQLSKYFIL